jgi:hypothetical protein
MGYFEFNKWRDNAMALWDESGLRTQARLSNLQKFVHFWILVAKSFNRNRLPVRASSMAYATLLALIPMLAVAVSVTSTFLKNEGEERINQFIVQFISSVVPPSSQTTNTGGAKLGAGVAATNSTVRPVSPEEGQTATAAATQDPTPATNRTALAMAGTELPARRHRQRHHQPGRRP